MQLLAVLSGLSSRSDLNCSEKIVSASLWVVSSVLVVQVALHACMLCYVLGHGCLSCWRRGRKASRLPVQHRCVHVLSMYMHRARACVMWRGSCRAGYRPDDVGLCVCVLVDIGTAAQQLGPESLYVPKATWL